MDPFSIFFLGTLVLSLVNLLVTAWVLGKIDGWLDLAACYPAAQPLPDQRHQLVTGSVAGFNTRRGLEVAVEDQGLFLATLFIFRPSHPPLRIPWHAIRAAYRQEGAWTDRTRLMVADCKGGADIPIVLPTNLLQPAQPHLPPIEPGPARRVWTQPVILFWGAMMAVGVVWFGIALLFILP